MLGLGEVINQERLLEKAEQLIAKGIRPGFDKMTPEAARLWIELNGQRLVRDVQEERYSPLPAVLFSTAKKDGTYRKLAVCTVLDRIVQGCLFDRLSDLCEGFFSEYSYAYRKGRGVAPALQKFIEYSSRFPFAAHLDVVGCYDHIDFDVLEKAVESLSDVDPKIKRLTMKYAKMPAIFEGNIERREKGIPQGNPLSTLLCNLYFHQLDIFLEQNKISFIRYADDLLLFSDDYAGAENCADLTRRFLQTNLLLSTHTERTAIKSPLDIQFLGHRLQRDKCGIIALKANDTAEGAYFTWHESKAQRSHQSVDILSDGVLRQKDYSLLFETMEGKRNIPLASVEMINIYSSVIFDSNFLQRALDSQIYVNLFNRHGELLGRFYPHTAIRNPMTTYKQLEFYFDERSRLMLAKQFLLASFHNTRIVIRYYQKHKPSYTYEMTLHAIDDYMKKIKACDDYNRLLLLEAAGRKEYYGCFDSMIKNEEMMFDSRQRRPPGNEINALMSFGYTVLYNMIAHKINKSSLDIRIGYLHATSGMRKESLNLDIAEIFKPLIVDRAIFTLLNLGALGKDHFHQEEDGGIYLNEEGKRIFLRKLYEKLDDTIQVKERHVTYGMLMDEEVRKLVRLFKTGEKYKAYRQVR